MTVMDLISGAKSLTLENIMAGSGILAKQEDAPEIGDFSNSRAINKDLMMCHGKILAEG
jgi:hypothetical protein